MDRCIHESLESAESSKYDKGESASHLSSDACAKHVDEEEEICHTVSNEVSPKKTDGMTARDTHAKDESPEIPWGDGSRALIFIGLIGPSKLSGGVATYFCMEVT